MSVRRLPRVVALAFCLAARTAFAQGQPVPATSKSAAQESYARGQRFFNAAEQKHDPKLYEASYLQFAQAYAIYPDDKVLWNLAVSELSTRRYLDAVGHLRLYDQHQHVLSQPTSPDYARFRENLRQAEQQTARLAIEAPQGATIKIDGSIAGISPLPSPVDLGPGKHLVDGQLGDVAMHAEAEVAAGATVLVTLSVPPSPLPVVGPGAAIIPDPHPTVVDSRTQYVGTTGTAVRWGLTGAAVLALGLGIGFDIVSHSDASNAASYLSSHPGACVSSATATCASYGQMLSDVNASRNLSYAFVGVGVAASLGALAAWIWWPKKRLGRVEGAWILPTGPHGLGFGFDGSF